MTIEGAELALKEFEEFPIKADKVVKDAMREASRVVVKDMKAKIADKSAKKMNKSKIADGAELTFANVGILRPKGNRMPWNYVYWRNYGTLQRRDLQHKFTYKRKAISAKWKGGIKPRNFFDKALAGEDDVWKKKFEESLKKKARERKILDEQK